MAKGWPRVSAGQLAALIAAGFFAAGMVAAIYVLIRLGALISSANRMLTDYHGRASALIENAGTAVDRAHEQLARTDAITASMDEVTANMAELSGHVSALAGLARGISAGFGTPLLRLSALTFGVRRALALRGTTRQRFGASRQSYPLTDFPETGSLARPESARPESALPEPALAEPALPGRAQRRDRRR
jgi:ABC-type transporter Mla subunit MlaD